ncbi:MAG: DUF6443 domain-containing protein, partial [Bacteroidota bacterium]
MQTHVSSLILFIMTMGSILAQSPDASQNYIRSTKARMKTTSNTGFEAIKSYGDEDDKVETIQYIDGLGRALQTVGWKDAPNRQDVITFHTYDAWGREAEAFLPYVANKNGDFTHIATAQIEQANFYNQTGSSIPNTSFPKAATQFEPAPLGRVLEQGYPGDAWQAQPNSVGIQNAGEHTVVYAYQVNTSSIKALKTSSNGVVSPWTYASGKLLLSITTDENGIVSKTYMDKLGRTLLSQVQTTAGCNTYATTAYGYDLYGMVKYAVQPEGWQLINQSNSNFNQTILDKYAFQYVYDAKGRMTQKKVPGADWTYMVYDFRDRLVLTQEGAQRIRNEWSFNIYDIMNRPIMTGIYQSSSTRTALQNVYDVPTVALYEVRQNTPWLDG